MSTGRLCTRIVHLAHVDEEVSVAAQRMAKKQVGTLVVVNDTKQPIGLLTDRDLIVRVLAPNRDARTTRVGTIMTAMPKTVAEDAPIEQALAVMRAGGFRRLPVVDEAGRLVGIVSMDDILELLAEEFQQIGRLLQGKKPTLASSRFTTRALAARPRQTRADTARPQRRSSRSRPS